MWKSSTLGNGMNLYPTSQLLVPVISKRIPISKHSVYSAMFWSTNSTGLGERNVLCRMQGHSKNFMKCNLFFLEITFAHFHPLQQCCPSKFYLNQDWRIIPVFQITIQILNCYVGRANGIQGSRFASSIIGSLL